MRLKISSANWRPPCHGLNVPILVIHDNVIKWNHFPRYWSFVRGIHRSPVNSPHKGQWSGALMFSLIFARINGWVNSREAGDLRRYRAHYDDSVMSCLPWHNDVTTWWRYPHRRPCTRRIHQSPVESLHKGPVMGRFDIFCSYLGLTLEQTIELSVIWDVTTLMCHHCDGLYGDYTFGPD